MLISRHPLNQHANTEATCSISAISKSMDVDTSNKPILYPCRPSAQDPFSDRRLLSQHLISLFHLSNSRSCAIAQHVACPPACPTSDLQALAADTSDMRVGPVAGANQNGQTVDIVPPLLRSTEIRVAKALKENGSAKLEKEHASLG